MPNPPFTPLTLSRPPNAPEKPAFGLPCNGCGFCCAREVCKLGEDVFGDDVQAPCPGLRFDGAKFRCNVVEVSDRIGGEGASLLRSVLGIGVGCDAEVE